MESVAPVRKPELVDDVPFLEPAVAEHHVGVAKEVEGTDEPVFSGVVIRWPIGQIGARRILSSRPAEGRCSRRLRNRRCRACETPATPAPLACSPSRQGPVNTTPGRSE
jgi:hypothetical protein